MKLVLLIPLMLVIFKYDFGQSTLPDFEWKKDVEIMLSEFLSCGGPISENSPCNIFLAKAIKRVYGINDFDKGFDKFMTANEIPSYVMFSDHWEKLGTANVQSVLNMSQELANQKIPVVAVYYNPNKGGHGHVALILPGFLSLSGTWNLNCPNSASFLLNHAEKSYVSKHLGFAFTPQINKEVELYKRNQ